MIEWKNVSFSYSEKMILEHINWHPDEITFLTGKSGSGKTTWLRLLLGLEKPTSGVIQCKNETFSAVLQEDCLCEQLSAWDNCIRLTKPFHGFAGKENGALKEIFELLFEEDLNSCSFEKLIQHTPTSSFSKGMKRRVGIARALFAESTCIVLDEPMSGLDERSAERVMAALRKYRCGRTLVSATHHELFCSSFEHSELNLD